MFSGSMVALVTPMRDNRIDYHALEALVERHIVSGTSALVIAGTTGESATLRADEKEALLTKTLQFASNRIPVIVGTGTYSTETTIENTQRAEDCGAQACLVVTPYYNKPTQEGLYQHFRAVAKATTVPLILYNVPARTGVDLTTKTLERLREFSNIVGLKEASGDLKRVPALLRSCPELDLYSGDDQSALAFMLQGGKGVISVTANVAPQAMAVMSGAALSRDVQLAGEVNTKLMPLHKNLFLESNPIPVKWALETLGWISPEIRLPLTRLSSEHHEAIEEAMRVAGVFECA